MGRSRGVREERTDHTKLFSRTLAGSGLTWHQKVHFSAFYGKLESQCTRNGPQNLPFCPGSPHNTFILFSSIFQNQVSQTYFKNSNIWKSENLKVWKRRAPENDRDLSSQKCFNFRGVLIGEKNRLQNRYLGTGNFAWELSHGNFCSRISGLGNWSPLAGETG